MLVGTMKTTMRITVVTIGVVAMGWWFNKRNTRMRVLVLPDEVGRVSIPAGYHSEFEDDSTLLVYPRSAESINLRFTCISFTKKDCSEAGGLEFIRDRAQEQNYLLQELPDKAVVSYEKESVEDGVALIIKYWEVGSKNTVVIISATIIKDRQDAPIVRETLKTMPKILKSLEITKLHRVIEDSGRIVEATVQLAEPTPQATRPFATGENKWLEENIARAKLLGAKYGTGSELTPEELDVIFSKWLHQSAHKEGPDTIVNALGAAYGEYLVKQHGF